MNRPQFNQSQRTDCQSEIIFNTWTELFERPTQDDQNMRLFLEEIKLVQINNIGHFFLLRLSVTKT